MTKKKGQRFDSEWDRLTKSDPVYQKIINKEKRKKTSKINLKP